jgi:hypothetical protein
MHLEPRAARLARAPHGPRLGLVELALARERQHARGLRGDAGAQVVPGAARLGEGAGQALDLGDLGVECA